VPVPVIDGRVEDRTEEAILADAAIEFRHKPLDHRLSNAGACAWSSGIENGMPCKRAQTILQISVEDVAGVEDRRMSG